MTENPSETSIGSRTESDQPPARVLSASLVQPARTQHPPGFDAGELHGLTVITTKRANDKNQGVYHCGRGDGEPACRQGAGHDRKLLSNAKPDPTLRPCGKCYPESGDAWPDGGTPEDTEHARLCPGCGEQVDSDYWAYHRAQCTSETEATAD